MPASDLQSSLLTGLSGATPATHHASRLNWEEVDWLQVLGNWCAAAIIILVGYWLAKWISRIVHRALSRHVELTLANFLRNLVYAVLMVVVLIAALQKVGVPITSLLAIVGTAGLAVGLALKDSLSNIASGVMLIVLRPFRDGDYVQIAGLEGTVEDVRIFQTRLRTADNRLIVLPNSTITAAPITNFTAKPQRRIDISIGVGYDDDLKKAREVLLKLAAAHPKVLREPATTVLVDKLGESTVDLILQAWTATPDYTTTRSELTEAIRVQLIDNGLNIPYPQRDLHVYHYNGDGKPLSEIVVKSVADDGDK